MEPAYVVMEVENLDKVAVLHRGLFLRNTLGVDLSEVVEIHDWVFSDGFAIESVRAGLVNPYPATLFLGRDLRLLD